MSFSSPAKAHARQLKNYIYDFVIMRKNPIVIKLSSLCIVGAAFQPRIVLSPAAQIAAGKPLPPFSRFLRSLS